MFDLLSYMYCHILVFHVDRLIVLFTNLFIYIYLYQAAFIPNVDQPDAGNIRLKEEGRRCFSA